jgi:hypothetical protein
VATAEEPEGHHVVERHYRGDGGIEDVRHRGMTVIEHRPARDLLDLHLALRPGAAAQSFETFLVRGR